MEPSLLSNSNYNNRTCGKISNRVLLQCSQAGTCTQSKKRPVFSTMSHTSLHLSGTHPSLSFDVTGPGDGRSTSCPACFSNGGYGRTKVFWCCVNTSSSCLGHRSPEPSVAKALIFSFRMYIYTCMYIYIYTYIHTHTHIRIQKHMHIHIQNLHVYIYKYIYLAFIRNYSTAKLTN